MEKIAYTPPNAEQIAAVERRARELRAEALAAGTRKIVRAAARIAAAAARPARA